MCVFVTGERGHTARSPPSPAPSTSPLPARPRTHTRTPTHTRTAHGPPYGEYVSVCVCMRGGVRDVRREKQGECGRGERGGGDSRLSFRQCLCGSMRSACRWSPRSAHHTPPPPPPHAHPPTSRLRRGERESGGGGGEGGERKYSVAPSQTTHYIHTHTRTVRDYEFRVTSSSPHTCPAYACRYTYIHIYIYTHTRSRVGLLARRVPRVCARSFARPLARTVWDIVSTLHVGDREETQSYRGVQRAVTHAAWGERTPGGHRRNSRREKCGAQWGCVDTCGGRDKNV